MNEEAIRSRLREYFGISYVYCDVKGDSIMLLVRTGSSAGIVGYEAKSVLDHKYRVLGTGSYLDEKKERVVRVRLKAEA